MNCPKCGQAMYRLDRSNYCPTEDPHPGGIVIFDDGLTLMWDLPVRDSMATSPKSGGANP